MQKPEVRIYDNAIFIFTLPCYSVPIQCSRRREQENQLRNKTTGGKSFDVISLKEEDVRAGTINSWIPQYNDPSISSEQVEVFSKIILTGSLLSGICGSWVVSDEWNRLMPDYKFTGTEEFLVKHWAGKS